MSKTFVPAAAALIGALALSGCVSLLPKSKPAQLYTFLSPEAAAQPSEPSGGAATDKIGVILTPPVFPRAGGGDQLLTVTGSQAAYIAESRWVSPAVMLFQDAVERAFLASPSTRLVRRTDIGAGSMTLRLDVDRFETDYAAVGGAPTVSVQVKATLVQRGGDFGAEQLFTASTPAADNRVGAIVAAYSSSVSKVTGDLRSWVESEAPKIEARQNAGAGTGGPIPPLRRPQATTRSTSTSSATVTQERQVQR